MSRLRLRTTYIQNSTTVYGLTTATNSAMVLIYYTNMEQQKTARKSR